MVAKLGVGFRLSISVSADFCCLIARSERLDNRFDHGRSGVHIGGFQRLVQPLQEGRAVHEALA